MGDTSGFIEARPEISIDGIENAGLKANITALLVEDTTEGMCRCEATFGNWGGEVFLYFDRAVLDFGKTIAITIGEGDARAQVFKGRISAIEAHYSKFASPDIVILAEDRLQDLRMTRRTRTFGDPDGITDADMIDKIAQEHGFLNRDIDISGPIHKILAQVNQSDLAFIRERARAADAEIWVEDTTFHAKKRSERRTTGDVTLTYQKGLSEFSITADLAGQRTELRVPWRDVAKRPEFDHKTKINETGTKTSIESELNGKQSGADILKKAFINKVDWIEQISHFSPSTKEEAKMLSDSYFCRMARRFVTGYGTADCDGRIRVGAHLKLKGLGEIFDGEYYVTQVKHTFDLQNGCHTHFAVERAWIP